jgi:hypothetical protein
VTAPSTEVTLSRELADFLIEFSVALHKHAIYPDGHPLLGQAVAGMTRRVGALLLDRPLVALGVARQQLVVEGVTTDPNSPVLRELALRLYKREIGAVKITRGVEEDEIAEMLKVVGRDAARDPDETRQWPHLRLFPLTYDQLELMADELSDRDTTWATQCWLGLARSALATDGDANRAAPSDPLVVARAIETRSRDQSYDRAIAGYLSHVAGEIRANGGPEAAALQRRVSQVVGALSPQALERLLDMGGDISERRRFVLDASHAMAVESVLDLVQTTAKMEGQTISGAMLGMLNKLARHADAGTATTRSKADGALRANLRQLVTGWDAGNASLPRQFGSMLQKLSADTRGAAESASHPCEPERIVQMSLETAVNGVSTGEAIATLVEEGKISALLSMVDASPEVNEVVEAIWEQLDTTDAVRAVLSQDPIDFDVLYRLVARVHLVALEPLLDALGEAKERNVRWKLFELIAQFGSDIGNTVVTRLEGAPWYVQRNLLLLLQRVPTLPFDFTPEPYARAEDVRVRREALKVMLRMSGMREQAIIDALRDADEHIIRFGLTAAIEWCPPAAVPVIIRRVHARDGDPQLGVLAVRALAGARVVVALECLLDVVLVRSGWFFGRRKIAPKSGKVLAALNVLATTWKHQPHARAAVALAATDEDPEIQGAVNTRAQPPLPRISTPMEAILEVGS